MCCYPLQFYEHTMTSLMTCENAEYVCCVISLIHDLGCIAIVLCFSLTLRPFFCLIFRVIEYTVTNKKLNRKPTGDKKDV